MRRRSNAVPRVSLFSFQDIITCTASIFILITLLLALELAARSEASPRATTPLVANTLAEEQDQLDNQLAELEAQMQSFSDVISSGEIVNASSLQNQIEDSRNRIQQLNRDQQGLAVLSDKVSKQQLELDESQRQRAPERTEIEKLQAEIKASQQKLSELKSANRVLYKVTVHSGRTPWLVEMGQGKIVAAPASQIRTSSPQVFNNPSEFLAWSSRQSAPDMHFIILLKPDSIDFYDKTIDELRRMGYAIGLDVLRNDQSAIDIKNGVN